MAISSSSMPRTAELYTTQRQIEQLETRSRSFSPEENQEKEKELKKVIKARQKLQTRVSLSTLLGIMIGVTILLAIVRAFPEGLSRTTSKYFLDVLLASFVWLLEAPKSVLQATGDFMALLAPFLAISVAIERLLETAFNWLEQSSRAVADILVAPREALDWVGKEYQDAYYATQEANETIGVETTPEALELLNTAEERLVKAEQRLRGWTSAPEYRAWKKALSIWCGLMIGLVVSVVGDLGILRYIGIATPRFIDMMITGLIIGSGPGPMHDLIGILQGGKDAISNLAELAKGKSVKEAAEALQKETEVLQSRKRGQ